jgi:hypothetical protein
MLKSRDFWVGIAIGALAFYVYQMKFKKGPSS